MVKKCKWCGKEFEAHNKNSKCCSKKCGQAWNRKKRIEKWREYACKKKHGGCENCNEEDCNLEVDMVKKCKRCGKRFVGDGRERYCSLECRMAAADGEENKRLKRVAKTCPVCGTDFMGKGSQRYCSTECSQSVFPGTRFTVNSSFMLLDRMLDSLTDEDALKVEKWLLKNSNDKTLRLHLENRRKSYDAEHG